LANRQISEDRKAVYYLGMVILVVGVLLFGSVMFTGMTSMGDFSNFEQRSNTMGATALIGMALVALGGILMGVGRAGLAGSGIVLDPEQAREDVEPWARAAGGVFKDALDESGLQLGAGEKKEEVDQALPFDEKLRKLHKLLEEGLVNQEEYEREKQKILDEA
jgi:hypothetical protein